MKKIISVLVLLCILVGTMSVIPFSVGAAEAITIASVDDWMDKLSGKDVGEADITVTAQELDFTGKTVEPIQNFKGTFDGNGVVIKNMNITTTGETGIFNCPAGDVEVKNLVITDSYFEGKKWVGTVFCCTGATTATIENVFIASSVTVKATDSVAGGLVGGFGKKTTTATVKDCVFAGEVISPKETGGVTGKVQSDTTLSISNTLVLGKLSPKGSSSGFVGNNSKVVNLTNCIYAGGAELEYFNSYPLVGGGTTNTTNCYTTHANHTDGYEGVVYKNGDTKVTYKGFGGANDDAEVTYLNKSRDSLIGLNCSTTVEGFTKRDGDIMIPNGVASFASTDIIVTCTVTWENYDGTVLDTDELSFGSTPEYAGGTPTRADDDLYTYTFMGWTPDILAVTSDVTYTATYARAPKDASGDTSNIWDEWDGTSDDPYNAEGEGTQSNPYVIRTAEQWANLAKTVNEVGIADGLYFVLEANLDFKNIYSETDPTNNLLPISLDGVKLCIRFDGKGHTIKGVNMVGTKDGTALFGDIWGDKDLSKDMVSVIKNFVVSESTFKREKGWVSAVVGETSGPVIIENVYVDKTVTIISSAGKGKAGGIVGGCYYSSGGNAEYTVTINDCVFAGTIIADGPNNGGLVGYVNSREDGGSDEIIHIVINRCLVVGLLPISQENSNGFVGYNGKLDYMAASGAKASVTINNSIYAGGAMGEYFTTYPFASAPIVTVNNCYSVAAGAENAMYETAMGKYSDNVTALSSKDAIIGLEASVTISGWTKRAEDVMVPTAVADIAPVFISDVTVKWEVNGEIVATENYKMGEMPTYKGETPTKADDDNYSYTFYGWSPAVSAAMGDVTYKAEFYKTRKNVGTADKNTDKNTDSSKTETAETNSQAAVSEKVEEKGGCGSMISGGAFALVAVIGSAVVLGRKKED